MSIVLLVRQSTTFLSCLYVCSALGTHSTAYTGMSDVSVVMVMEAALSPAPQPRAAYDDIVHPNVV